MKLSIIIVNWNTKNILKQTLNSILKETKSIEYEIIVVDNNSNDESIEMIKGNFSSVVLIENKTNKGFAVGNNDGFKIAKGEYLMLLNSDTIIQENAIEKLVKFLDKNKKIMMVGPKLLNKDGSFQESCKRNLPNIKNSFLYLFSINKNKYKTKKNEDISGYTEAISGAAMMIRREVYEKIGGLDERFFMYAEDLDYCKQIYDLDWKTYYLSEAKIIHLGGESSKQKGSKSLYYFYKTMWQYYKKYFGEENNFIVNFFIYLGIKFLYFYKLLRKIV